MNTLLANNDVGKDGHWEENFELGYERQTSLSSKEISWNDRDQLAWVRLNQRIHRKVAHLIEYDSDKRASYSNGYNKAVWNIEVAA